MRPRPILRQFDRFKTSPPSAGGSNSRSRAVARIRVSTSTREVDERPCVRSERLRVWNRMREAQPCEERSLQQSAALTEDRASLFLAAGISEKRCRAPTSVPPRPVARFVRPWRSRGGVVSACEMCGGELLTAAAVAVQAPRSRDRWYARSASGRHARIEVRANCVRRSTHSSTRVDRVVAEWAPARHYTIRRLTRTKTNSGQKTHRSKNPYRLPCTTCRSGDFENNVSRERLGGCPVGRGTTNAGGSLQKENASSKPIKLRKMWGRNDPSHSRSFLRSADKCEIEWTWCCLIKRDIQPGRGS